MAQESLFHEDMNDALGAVIIALGGYKSVANQLWPTLNLKTAYARLKACVNPDKNEKLSPEEFIWLLVEARKINCHALIHFCCDMASYERPNIIDPEDERAELQRQFISSLKEHQALLARLEKLQKGGGK